MIEKLVDWTKMLFNCLSHTKGSIPHSRNAVDNGPVLSTDLLVAPENSFLYSSWFLIYETSGTDLVE